MKPHAAADARPPRNHRTPTPIFLGVIGLSAAFGALAPLAPTGTPAVDAIERALLASAFVFIGAHAKRSALLWTGGLVAAASRDLGLALSVAALAAIVFELGRRRRRKWVNAIAAGLLANALLHTPAGHPSDLMIAIAVAAPVPALVSGRRHLRSRHRRVVDRVSLAVGSVVVVIGVLAGVGGLMAAGDLRSGADAARTALERVKDGDTDGARDLLERSEADLGAGRSALAGWTTPGRAIPLLAQNIDAATTAIDEARSVAAAGNDLVTSDYQDLRYDGLLDLDRIEDLVPAAARATVVLERASDRLAAAADGPVVSPLAARIAELGSTIDETERELAGARAILERLPSIMGADRPRRYLVVFTQPAESRAGGGFIGNWLDLQIDAGEASIARSGRILDLIDLDTTQGRRTLDSTDDYVRRYGRLNPHHYVQDATISPDWPSVARNLATVYPKAGGVEVDGVIAMDPAGLASLLELTGPVTVDGLDAELTASTAEQILTRSQYLDHPDRSAREEVLEAASRRTFEVLTSSSLPTPRTMGDALGPAVRGRHIQIWLEDGDDQTLVEELGVDGSLEIPTGSDGFMVIQQNAGNNKIDAYRRRRIAYDITLDPTTGLFEGTLVITIRNEVPSLDMPDAVVGNARGAPRGTNLSTLSVHAPWHVTRATIDGVPFIPGRGSEAGLNAWDTPLLAVPLGGTVEVAFEIEGAVDLSDGYSIDVIPQPSVEADEFTAVVSLASSEFVAGGQSRGGLDASVGTDEIRVDGDLDEVARFSFPIDT